MTGAPASPTILPRRDPSVLEIDVAKLQRLTMKVGTIAAAATGLHLDAGTFLESNFTAVAPEQLTRRGRLKRWGQLHAVRSLAYDAASQLRHAASRLETEYQLVEEQLCALQKSKRLSRVRRATSPKA